MIPAQRLYAAASASAAVLAGIVLVANPGAALARTTSRSVDTTSISRSGLAEAPASSDLTRRPAATSPTAAAAAAAAAPVSGTAKSTDAEATGSTPPTFTVANARRSTSGLPDFPAADGTYPTVRPALHVGATRMIVSEGIPLHVQNVGYGDPAEHNSYDVYWPTSPSLRRGGAVLMIHGGAWVMGRRDLDTPYALAVARAGYVVAVMDYSTWPDLRAWPAAIQDTFAVADSFRSRAGDYGFDPAHLVAAGWSAGGNLAELLGTVGRGTDRVAAVVSWSGISDLTALTTAPSTVPLANTMAQLFGCSVLSCPQTWLNASPVNYVGTGDSPMLMFAGSREFIPTTQSSNLADKLQAAGVTAGVDILDTDLHGGDQRPFTNGPLMAWLHRYADASTQAGETAAGAVPALDVASISPRGTGK